LIEENGGDPGLEPAASAVTVSGIHVFNDLGARGRPSKSPEVHVGQPYCVSQRVSRFGDFFLATNFCPAWLFFGRVVTDLNRITGKTMLRRMGGRGNDIREIKKSEQTQDLNGGQVLGRFANGEPAIVEKSYGKGKAILAGTFLGLSYERLHAASTKSLLLSVAKAAGALSSVEVTGPGTSEVEIRRLLAFAGKFWAPAPWLLGTTAILDCFSANTQKQSSSDCF
jgi:hypothetical protein